jgi:hypothetical protein
MDPVRIFVGCSANGEDAEAQAMLEYTIKHYTTSPVEMNWMMLSNDPASPWYSNPQRGEGWNTRGWATPFSAFRWWIPYVCNFKGKAIYMDVDQIARAPMTQLWDQTIPDGKAILAKNEKTFCVMLIDCERLAKKFPPFEQLRRVEGFYRQVRNMAAPLVAKFEGNWNCLDGENYKTLWDNDIKVIHFTKVETQPHFKYALPRLKTEGKQHWNRQAKILPHMRPDVEPLVDRLWKEAQAAGYTVDRYLKDLQPYGSYDAVRGGTPRTKAA